MKIKKLNMYQRLRDFRVPAAVLDEIFSHESDLAVLSTAWKELKKTGVSEDEVANSIAEQIFKDLKIEPDQEPDEKNMN